MTTPEYKTCAYCIHEGYDYNGYTCAVRPGIHKGTDAIHCADYKKKEGW